MIEVERTSARYGGAFTALKTPKAKQPFLNNMKLARLVPVGVEDIVLDIGAWIGEYSMLAAAAGAKAIAVEANPTVIPILEKNARGRNIEVINAAVTREASRGIPFIVGGGLGCMSHVAIGVDEMASDKAVTVRAMSYESLVNRFSPTIVKIDIEGGEYDLGPLAISPQIHSFIIEFHGAKMADGWRESADAIITELDAKYFSLHAPELAGDFRATKKWTGVWSNAKEANVNLAE